MPTSPIKRVTRARAKAVEEESGTTTTRMAGAAAAKAKAAGAARITTASVKAMKTAPKQRGRKAEQQEDVIAVEEDLIEEEPKLVKSTRGRKKAVPEPMAEAIEVMEEVHVEAPKPRGRPRKTATNETTSSKATVKETAAQEKRNTRSRATATKPAVPSRTVTTRKKVTFQDPAELDKENKAPPPEQFKRPSSADGKDTSVGKMTGLRAKPVRRPAAPTRTTRRGRKAADEAQPHEVPLPLSPKKPQQITLGPTIDEEEDELSGSKTPMRPLNKSPVKPAASVHGTSKKPVSILDFAVSRAETTTDNVSPSKQFASSIMTSPAKRPASPIKEFKDVREVKDTKADSPKKLGLGNSLSHPPLRPPTSPMKASIRSPARRLPLSPAKLFSASPAKSSLLNPITSSSPSASQVNTFKLPIFSPQKTLTCAFRAVRSPDRTPKVHKMTPEEQLQAAVEDATCSPLKTLLSFGSPLASTPLKLSKTSPRSSKIPVRMKTPPASPKADTIAVVSEVDLHESNEGADLQDDEEGAITPPGSPPKGIQKAFDDNSPAAEHPSDESDSEDELSRDNPDYSPSPIKHRLDTPKSTLRRQAAQGTLFEKAADEEVVFEQARFISMTPLAHQFGSWQGASPDKKVLQRRLERQSDMFSLRKLEELTALPPMPQRQPEPEPEPELDPDESVIKSTFFEDEMSVREMELDQRSEEDELQAMDEGPEPEVEQVKQHQPAVEEEAVRSFGTESSECSQEYGDENEPPIDPALLALDFAAAQEQASVSVPEPGPTVPTVIHTPARAFSQAARTFHTVSKVPLKPAAEGSPSRPPIKRSNSFAGSLSPRKETKSPMISRNNTVISFSPRKDQQKSMETPKSVQFEYSTPSKLAETPTQMSGIWSSVGTPARTPRPDLNPQTLKGAVVHVDVHTTEGADASGIFVELLTQMGARCVKQWSWNPNASAQGGSPGGIDGAIMETSPSGTPAGNSKIGITHVVFKDGGKRTLEKVRDSKGVVLCVGVGWVLDCERENKWLDESDYAVDISMIPRGGHRRRKSMEPRALSNINGHLIPMDSPAAKDLSAHASPTKEFLTFSPIDAPYISSMAGPEQLAAQTDAFEAPATPFKLSAAMENATDLGSEISSPMTPYIFNPSSLVQQTCPPKQTQASLFPVSGNIEEQPDEIVRRRLLLARRKSLQWAPKVASPLGKRVLSWGEN